MSILWIMIHNTPIKILMVTTTDGMAGLEKNLYDLLRLIDRDQYKPKLIVLRHEEGGMLMEKVRELGISVECINIQSKWRFYRLLKLWRIIREYQPDILESFLYFDNQVCRIMGTLTKTPIVISGLQNVQTKQSWMRKLLDRLTVKLVDAVISNSDAGKSLYISRGYVPAKKMFIAKSGIDMKQLQSLQSQYIQNGSIRSAFGIKIPEGYYTLFSAGFLTEQKGITYLLRALVQLKEQHRNIICFIAGEGNLRHSLQQECGDLGLSGTVHFVGYQTAAYQYLPLFDAYVLPSLWEGLPNAVIEAMASRVVVVATRMGGIAELITDNVTGFLSKPGDAEAFAHAIGRVMDLPADDRVRILDAAYQHIVTSFTTDSMVAGYTACYKQLLKIP